MAYLYVRCYNYRHCIQPDFLKKAGIQRFRKSRNTELPKKREYRAPEKAGIRRSLKKREYRFPEKNRDTEFSKSGNTDVPGNTANIENTETE